MDMKSLIVWAAVAAMISGGAVSADVSSPYGINSHVPNVATLDMIQNAGIGWIRIDMNWFQMEPNRDGYNWGFMDAVVNNARARGLEIFATLAYTPAWANGTGNIADPPLDIADWYDFVYDTVHRYRGSIQHWGMWNEPNLEQFFTGNGWQYREWILKPGAQAAKAADPVCFVLGPELAHLSSTDWPSWMEEAVIAGGIDHIDIITHHCYKGDSGDDVFHYLDEGFFYPWDPPPLMTVLKNLGADDRPVWLTEVGWHTDEISEAEQALYYHQLLWGILDRGHLDKVFPYEIKDDPTPGIPLWGIIYADNTPKQAYFTYQSFIAGPTEPEHDPIWCGQGLASPAAGSADLVIFVLIFAWPGLLLFRRR